MSIIESLSRLTLYFCGLVLCIELWAWMQYQDIPHRVVNWLKTGSWKTL